MQHRAVLGAFRGSLVELFELVGEVQKKPSQSAKTCLQIQLKLIKRIKYVEKRLREYKKAILSESNPKRIGFLKDGRDQYRKVLLLFKKVGDCLAFTYLNSFDIKPHSYGNDSGFISGKLGLRLEVEFLKQACNANFPALLTDLTNVFRHGDLLVFSETGGPKIVEVKRGKLGGRGHRQMKRLRSLTDYLNSDKTNSFFGKEISVHRTASKSPAKYNHKAIRKVVEQAYLSGLSFRKIEEGLFYSAITDDDSEVLDLVTKHISKPFVFYLNEHKLEPEPIPYTPLIHILRNPQFSWDFYCGQLIIFVFVDMEIVEAMFGKNKCGFSWNESDSDYFSVHHPDPDIDYLKVSKAFFARVGFEFLSLNWFVDRSCTISKQDLSLLESKNGA